MYIISLCIRDRKYNVHCTLYLCTIWLLAVCVLTFFLIYTNFCQNQHQFLRLMSARSGFALPCPLSPRFPLMKINSPC